MSVYHRKLHLQTSGKITLTNTVQNINRTHEEKILPSDYDHYNEFVLLDDYYPVESECN